MEVTYTPESQLRNPRLLLQNMWRDLLSSRELAFRLLVRNINARYRQTLLGYAWAFLPPVFTTLTFVFLNSQRIFSVDKTYIPYPAYVMIGTLLWQVFIDAMSSPLRIINESKSFLTKVNFPRESLIITGLGEVLFNFFIRLILLFLVFFYYRLTVHATVILFPLGIIALASLGLMFGILLTPFGILFSDIEKSLPMISSIWFFLTPIVYKPPTTWPASLLSFMNPVSPILSTTRDMLTTGNLSQLTSFLVIFTATIILLFLGWVLYRLALPHLIERMGA